MNCKCTCSPVIGDRIGDRGGPLEGRRGCIYSRSDSHRCGGRSVCSGSCDGRGRNWCFSIRDCSLWRRCSWRLDWRLDCRSLLCRLFWWREWRHGPSREGPSLSLLLASSFLPFNTYPFRLFLLLRASYVLVGDSQTLISETSLL